MPFDPIAREVAEIRATLLALSFEVKLLKLSLAARRGQWLARKTDDDEDEGPDDDDGPNSPHLMHLAQYAPPAPGQGGPPKIPEERPPSSSLRTQIARFVANQLADAIKDGRGREYLESVLERAAWLRERADQIVAVLDPPKPLNELMRLTNEPANGYQIHHIVDRTAARASGFTQSEIDSPTNLVRVPKLKHYTINAHYATPNGMLGGLTPREYLSDKPWHVRRDYGLSYLRDIGVLE